MKYIPPIKFCVFPSMGYWALNGKPISAREAQHGAAPGVTWESSEIALNLKDYVGYFE